MKHTYLTAILLCALCLLSGCEDKCKVKSQYSYYEPVYSTSDEIKAAVGIKASQDVGNPGRIYLKDNLLLINEVGKGIHLFDNGDSRNPKAISFLSIPGNNDMAVFGNTLYTDSYIDLVVFDIANLANIKEVSRIEGFFNPNQFYFYNESENTFVTDWVKKEEVTVYESECDAQLQPWGGIYYNRGIAVNEANFSSFNKLATASISSPGIGGSTARFTINGDYLYVLDESNLNAVDISIAHNPVAKGSTNLSWDIETIFPYQDKLFIGSQTGMYIISLNDPENPQTLSIYEHLRSCDPVVVEGNNAYVTLRDGSECAGFLNQLEILDITDLSNPMQVAVYPMTNPHGLGIDQGTLFICDGNDGLKIFDATDLTAVDKNQLAHYENIHALDVIPFNNIAILIGETGLYQYDYSNVKDIKLLSTIPFSK